VEFLKAETLSDIDRDKVEEWVEHKAEEHVTNRTINAYLVAISSFMQWAFDTKKIASPSTVCKTEKRNEEINRKKERRALTDDEIPRLFTAARTRKRRGKRSGEETALIYETMLGTGLRSSELASIKIHQINFDKNEIKIKAQSEKRRRGTNQPITPALAKSLKKWIADTDKKQDDYLFVFTPESLRESFKIDCVVAKIPYMIVDGRTVDVHCLRRTFGTMLARAGVPLTTTQKLMRHSSPTITAKYYIDVDPVDLHTALSKIFTE
jgi:Site-specific recombinase XerD